MDLMKEISRAWLFVILPGDQKGPQQALCDAPITTLSCQRDTLGNKSQHRRVQMISLLYFRGHLF